MFLPSNTSTAGLFPPRQEPPFNISQGNETLTPPPEPSIRKKKCPLFGLSAERRRSAAAEKMAADAISRGCESSPSALGKCSSQDLVQMLRIEVVGGAVCRSSFVMQR